LVKSQLNFSWLTPPGKCSPEPRTAKNKKKSQLHSANLLELMKKTRTLEQTLQSSSISKVDRFPTL
jgi:hypothetical protein